MKIDLRSTRDVEGYYSSIPHSSQLIWIYLPGNHHISHLNCAEKPSWTQTYLGWGYLAVFPRNISLRASTGTNKTPSQRCKFSGQASLTLKPSQSLSWHLLPTGKDRRLFCTTRQQGETRLLKSNVWCVFVCFFVLELQHQTKHDLNQKCNLWLKNFWT